MPPAPSRQPSHTTNPWAILPGTPGTASPTHLISGHARRVSGSNGFPWRSETGQGEDDDGVEEEEAELQREMDEIAQEDDERGLEETLEKLGMGAYHWRLLALCGFGWMSDNSALQCIGKSLRVLWALMDIILRRHSCHPTESSSAFRPDVKSRRSSFSVDNGWCRS